MSAFTTFFGSSYNMGEQIAQMDKEERAKQIRLFEAKKRVNDLPTKRDKRLQGILDAFQKEYDLKRADEQEYSISPLMLLGFGVTCFSGLLCAFLEGIDGIASILELLSLPPIISTLVLTSFVLISITVFVGFDLTEAAKLLGIEMGFQTQSPFALIVEQKNQIRDINHYLERAISQTKSVKELEQIREKLTLLININSKLDSDINGVDHYLENDPVVLTLRNFAAISCACLYLSFGFFTGQAGILYVLGYVSMAAVMAQPLLIGLVLGGATFSAFGCAAFYWLVQRPGVENLMCKMLYGFDLESLESVKSHEYQSVLSCSLECKQTMVEKALANSKPNQISASALHHGIGMFAPAIKSLAGKSQANDLNFDVKSSRYQQH